EDDDIKLWRECNDGLYWTQKSCQLKKEQFGIIGIQVTGCRLSLNVLIRDELEIHRYYKLHEAEIPIRYSNDPSILADFIYTLLLFCNTLIVNMSLLRSAHDRRSNRNLDSLTVTPPSSNY
ncbi:74_t:CDS:1, partial [Diversispora eburnea]